VGAQQCAILVSSMLENFWEKLPSPFFVLAPMADVTDVAFRQIIAKYSKFARTADWRGGPDVMYTEFVSADGLCHPEGRKRLLLDLKYGENERPIVAQLFSGKVAKMREAAKIVRELGFDGLDINMGCPDKTIEKQGAGAALIKNPKLAQELIYAAKEGFGGPVSVKTRLGYSSVSEMENWVRSLCEAKPVAIVMHLRTRREMSKVPAHWELAGTYSKVLKNFRIKAIANGDVVDLADAKKKAEKNNLDGAMLGKAVLGNPYLFANLSEERLQKAVGPLREQSDSYELTTNLKERLHIMVEHTELFEKYFHNVKSFAIMKKFFKSYISGHPQAKELQERLMRCSSAEEIALIVSQFSMYFELRNSTNPTFKPMRKIPSLLASPG